ncbi:universal stress protein [Acidovorax sp. sif1233]|uniref:universal stress protein n=1 Tax=unclassified Acidovorax TaxID=2684926 RepID=UPI001C488CE6|nr:MULTISPECIES: universal stress protein [unclassified Acidovorax]MBV7429874.1 universal stress protein [Acidovorax sp. sif0732]MBV7451267.1 universal stress protein [Acidovorax sp. sif0715]MBV7454349.1 universal stress protein [Acidovorax sp. sif1233]
MYKHILMPSDGTALSEAAILRGMRFAREAHAKVTGFYALPEFHALAYHTAMLEHTRKSQEDQARARAEEVLNYIRETAAQYSVPCDTLTSISDHPYEAIIDAAHAQGCDLILMASHGRRGLQGILLGSETLKVLTHSKIPVLVHR